jgi:hypothetical protein
MIPYSYVKVNIGGVVITFLDWNHYGELVGTDIEI